MEGAPTSDPAGRLAERLDAGFVVLTHGTETRAAHVVGQLHAARVELERVVVVHNPVTPADRLDLGEDVLVHRMRSNAGYAPAMNAGLRLHLDAGRRWVAVLTHDVHLRPGALEAWLAAADEAEGYGALGPVLYLRGSGDLFSAGGMLSRYGGPYHRREPWGPGEPVRPVDWLDGAAILYRAAALEQAGLYDEHLYSYSEDSQLALRLRAAGWRSGVVVGAHAEQEPGGASRPGLHAYLMVRNNLGLRRLHSGPRGVLAGLGGWLVESARLVRRAARAGGREGRRRELLVLTCGWRGAADYLRGRTGPPPRLPGAGG